MELMISLRLGGTFGVRAKLKWLLSELARRTDGSVRIRPSCIQIDQLIL